MKNVLAVVGLVLICLFVGFLLFSDKKIKVDIVHKQQKAELISKPIKRTPRRVEDDSYMGPGLDSWKKECKRKKKTRDSRIECMDIMRADHIY